MTNLKILTPVTSGLNANNLLFGALTNADANASLFTINALADFISTINLKLGNSTVNVVGNSVVSNSVISNLLIDHDFNNYCNQY